MKAQVQQAIALLQRGTPRPLQYQRHLDPGAFLPSSISSHIKSSFKDIPGLKLLGNAFNTDFISFLSEIFKDNLKSNSQMVLFSFYHKYYLTRKKEQNILLCS